MESDGALLDHAAAESHDILVQVIAHSGVSCRKTLTINVLPAGSGQTAAPKPDVMQGPLEAADTPPLQTQESFASKEPVAPLGSGREIEPLNVGKVDRRDKEFVGVDDVDTMHLDGVAGGPGVGGWSIELTEGEIVETKDDHVNLSKNSSGNVMLHGCPVKVAFQGVERIEWETPGAGSAQSENAKWRASACRPRHLRHVALWSARRADAGRSARWAAISTC